MAAFAKKHIDEREPVLSARDRNRNLNRSCKSSTEINSETRVKECDQLQTTYDGDMTFKQAQ